MIIQLTAFGAADSGDDEEAEEQKSAAAPAELASKATSTALPAGSDAANVFVQVRRCLQCLLPYAAQQFSCAHRCADHAANAELHTNQGRTHPWLEQCKLATNLT